MIDHGTGRRIRAHAVGCSLVLALCAACDGGGSSRRADDGGPHDATTPISDASPGDGGSDAGSDAGSDSGTDASSVVTPPNAGSADGGLDGGSDDAAIDGGGNASIDASNDAALDDGGTDTAVDEGRGEPCSLSGANTCRSGLSCAYVMNNPVERDLCPHIASPGASDGCCLPTRGLGDHCGLGANGEPQCETGLSCFLPSNEAGRTVTCSGFSNCCVPSGGLNQICRADDSCDGALVCTNASTDAERAACGTSPFCCLPADGVD